MVPPNQNLNLDVAAVSGICGSISIACWVVVFSPQIIENFRRSSADGLSLLFVIIWLVGDVFNILGAVIQGVLPTMIILAVYYTIADVVLLGQCFYYRGFTWRDDVVASKPDTVGEATERTGLLLPVPQNSERDRRVSATHLSPVVPLLDGPQPQSNSTTLGSRKPYTWLQATIFNLFAIFTVCSAGILGWAISEWSEGRNSENPKPYLFSEGGKDGLRFSLWGQIFGYLCAVLYLGSRVPQLLLNYRRKSTDGVSMLFFIFACIGNLLYVLSIFAHEGQCSKENGKCTNGEASGLYARYILINASWLAGSMGTLVLDMAIFVQFFLYRKVEVESDGNTLLSEAI